ncbi:predicted protein [Histoplasma capsulatum var. duboisii H88]|uniref:Predicted protein n=1 Tax=Ajellomyces capsulatus (strain H88) TaxID=544711 RepID=F0UUR7_AJEC8|nr:predicted protein [Histoplasma capsulatum var. duboisii H88]
MVAKSRDRSNAMSNKKKEKTLPIVTFQRSVAQKSTQRGDPRGREWCSAEGGVHTTPRHLRTCIERQTRNGKAKLCSRESPEPSSHRAPCIITAWSPSPVLLAPLTRRIRWQIKVTPEGFLGDAPRAKSARSLNF